MLGQQENDLETLQRKHKRMSEETNKRLYPVPNTRNE